LVPEDRRNHHRLYHKDFFANPRSRPMGIGLDLSGRRKDGASFPVEISLGYIDIAEGRLAVAFVDDITERKRLEAAAKADHEEIRALASRLLTVQEEERRRVSREIHDDFCQQLAALAFEVGGLIVEPLPDPIRARLQALEARLTNLSANGRHLAYRLHPSILEDLGLAVSLQALCEEFSQRKGVVVKFRSRNVPSVLPIPVMSCLYRIAQEGLRNAIEHSGAKHITAALIGKENAVRLSIRDDGVGFDRQSAKGKGRLGLVSMEERVHLINGKLSIKSAPGHSTRIVVTTPLFGGDR
jgi:signal transduction histidine kinase